LDTGRFFLTRCALRSPLVCWCQPLGSEQSTTAFDPSCSHLPPLILCPFHFPQARDILSDCILCFYCPSCARAFRSSWRARIFDFESRVMNFDHPVAVGFCFFFESSSHFPLSALFSLRLKPGFSSCMRDEPSGVLLAPKLLCCLLTDPEGDGATSSFRDLLLLPCQV